MMNNKKKKKRILLHHHIYEREYEVLKCIKDCLENDGYIVGMCDFMDISTSLEFRPDIIVTHPIRTSEDTWIQSLLKIATGAIVITYTAEGYYDLDDPKKVMINMGFDPCPVDLVDYFMVWGKKNALKEGEYLVKSNKIGSQDQIKVVGYIPYQKGAIKYNNNPTYEGFCVWTDKYEYKVLCITGFQGAEYTIEDAIIERTIYGEPGTEEYNNEIAKKQT